MPRPAQSLLPALCFGILAPPLLSRNTIHPSFRLCDPNQSYVERVTRCGVDGPPPPPVLYLWLLVIAFAPILSPALFWEQCPRPLISHSHDTVFCSHSTASGGGAPAVAGEPKKVFGLTLPDNEVGE